MINNVLLTLALIIALLTTGCSDEGPPQVIGPLGFNLAEEKRLNQAKDIEALGKLETTWADIRRK